MISEKIIMLRNTQKLTQSAVAKHLGITRSSVNAWELGISVPSTQYIVELANLFSVSADFLLGLDTRTTINVNGLTDSDVEMVHQLISYLKEKNNK